MIKNSQPFGKKIQKTVGGIFLTHTVQQTAARERLKLKSRFSAIKRCKKFTLEPYFSAGSRSA